MRTQRAFTLIELLIVIAIVTVLAGLVFPVVARAREKARQASCAGNTRQLALAILMYADDHEETLPPVAYGHEHEAGDEHDADDEPVVLWTEMVAPYLKSRQVLLCPSDTARKSSYGLNE